VPKKGGGGLVATQKGGPCHQFFQKKLNFFLKKFKIFLGTFEELRGNFGRMDVQHLHFLKLAPTLGSVKSSIPHGAWRFHFFPNFFC
jgi:hypothetical protein